MAEELETFRLAAIRDYESHIEKVWKDYGVHATSLNEEMTTQVWKTKLVGRKRHFIQVEMPLGTNLNSILEKHLNFLLLAADTSELGACLRKAKSSVYDIALYLWAREKADGPFSAERYSKQAYKAEYLAGYLQRTGKESYALQQKKRAAILRRKAAGEDIELPKRADGITTKLRELYASMEKDKPRTRAELIGAGIQAGAHPGTCAVQYAQYRREQKEAK